MAPALFAFAPQVKRGRQIEQPVQVVLFQRLGFQRFQQRLKLALLQFVECVGAAVAAVGLERFPQRFASSFLPIVATVFTASSSWVDCTSAQFMKTKFDIMLLTCTADDIAVFDNLPFVLKRVHALPPGCTLKKPVTDVPECRSTPAWHVLSGEFPYF